MQLLPPRKRNSQFEKKAIQLGFRQRIGAFHLEGILRRHHEKGLVENVRGVPDGDLLLLHGFEQGRLGFWRGAIDFVGQQEIREDRPGLEIHDLFAVAVILHYRGADHIGGHQVGRELDARILQRNGLRQRAHEQSLAHARHPLQQNVRAGQQRNQHSLDHLALTDDRFGDFASQVHHLPGERFDLAFERLVAFLIFRQHFCPSFTPIEAAGFARGPCRCVRSSAARTAGNAPVYFPARIP